MSKRVLRAARSYFRHDHVTTGSTVRRIAAHEVAPLNVDELRGRRHGDIHRHQLDVRVGLRRTRSQVTRWHAKLRTASNPRSLTVSQMASRIAS